MLFTLFRVYVHYRLYNMIWYDINIDSSANIFDIDNKLFQFLFDYTKNDQTQSTYIF